MYFSFEFVEEPEYLSISLFHNFLPYFSDVGAIIRFTRESMRARICWIKLIFIKWRLTQNTLLLRDTCCFSFLGVRHHVCYFTTTCHPQIVHHHGQTKLLFHLNPILCQQPSSILSLVDKGWLFARSTATSNHSHGDWRH